MRPLIFGRMELKVQQKPDAARMARSVRRIPMRGEDNRPNIGVRSA